MKHIRYFLAGYRKESILAPLFKMLEALMDLFVPLVVANIIDVAIPSRDGGILARGIAVLVLLAALGLLFSFTAQYFAARASVGTASKLRQALFDHIQSLSCTELDTLGTSTLITRMTTDVNQVQTGLNMGLRLLLRSPFIVFGSMIMAFTIDVREALVFVVAIPVLSVVVFGIMAVTIPMYRKVQQELDEVVTRTRENLTGVRVIRAFCKEEDEVERFDAINGALTGLNERVGGISALMNPGTYFLIQVATIVLIYQGALRVQAGGLEQGQVVALYNYMAQMIVELIKLASLIITINRAIACGERVESVFAIESSMAWKENGTAAAAEDGAPAISMEDVCLTYKGAGAESLTDISFTAGAGETIGVIGGTGSGKTSLISLIPRFYDATKGCVRLFGRDVRDLSEEEIIRTVGVVPQRAVLFAGTLRENMQIGRQDVTDEEIYEALRISQALEFVESKNEGLDFVIEQGGRNLSGGQRQRLTIARALVKDPKILILDDSASALDFATDLKLRRAIAGLSGERCVVIVSQRSASVKDCDKILVLDDGDLAGIGTHGELLKGCPVYQEIYYSQFPEERPASPVGGEVYA